MASIVVSVCVNEIIAQWPGLREPVEMRVGAVAQAGADAQLAC